MDDPGPPRTSSLNDVDEFVDILTDLERLGSLRWVLRQRQFPVNPTNGSQVRTGSQIADSVLKSERVCFVVTFLARFINDRTWFSRPFHHMP